MTADTKMTRALTRWRALSSPVSAVVSTGDGKTKPVEVYRQVLDRPGRVTRAIKGWAICWGLAVVSILVPVAHFVLVPAFAIAGPVVAWIRMRQESVILGAIVDCPACGEQTRLARTADDWPITLYCKPCRVGLDINRR